MHARNYGVYGARKVWLALTRDGIAVARWTVEQRMRDLSITAGKCPTGPTGSATADEERWLCGYGTC